VNIYFSYPYVCSTVYILLFDACRVPFKCASGGEVRIPVASNRAMRGVILIATVFELELAAAVSQSVVVP
jgi:hypothetical protein